MHILYTQEFKGKKVEAIYVITNFPRTAMKKEDRSKYTALGESSSYDDAYSGVQPQSWAGMHKISRENKQTILTSAGLPPSPSAGVFDDTGGVPLFWQERKPEMFYKVLFKSGR